jgi:hypothetical protein
MPGWKVMPRAGVAKSPSGSGDFHGYLARNLSDGYRLAVVTVDDQVGAVAIVHRAITAAWRGATTASERDVDEAFGRRLDSEVESAIRTSGRDPIDSARDPFEAALADLDGRQQIELARAFGPWESTATADGGSGPTGPTGPIGRAGSGDRAAMSALRALAARLETDDANSWGTQNPERRLRALYESRDPGAPAPLQLRMRLQQDYREAEVAAAASSRRSRGWGPSFAINAFLALTTLTLLVALASTVDLRASAAASADPTGDPIAPLTITGVSPVQGGIDGGAVHVGATQQTLIVGFPPSPLWHQSSQDCQADVVGVIDWQGQTSWIGARAGHAEAIAGDPSSPSAYVSGPGSYCQLVQFVSIDGGATWSAGPLPGAATSSPAWIAFDPAHAHRLLAYYPGLLYTSSDSGTSWTSRTTAVTPVAFDPNGRLVGWSSGKLFDSLDDGASWVETGPGPAEQPVAAGAFATGALIGTRDGLWWYPLTAVASRIQSGAVFSIATLAQGAVVVGADANGHPWLGTVDSSAPGISLAALPGDMASLQITDGQVAANDTGAVLALSGGNSILALATFAH